MSDTLFGDDQSQEATPAPAATPEVPEAVAELIGEGKKYADVNTALSALAPAQDHISKIEGENELLRRELEKSAKLEEVLQKLEGKGEPEVTPSAEAPSPEELVKAVVASLEQKDQVNQQKANLGAVKAKLEEVYGERAPEVFAAKATELGMTPEGLTKLAKDAPTAAISLIGIPKAEPSSQSSDEINTERLNVGEEAEHQSIMFGSNTEDVVAEWRASAPKS